MSTMKKKTSVTNSKSDYVIRSLINDEKSNCSSSPNTAKSMKLLKLSKSNPHSFNAKSSIIINTDNLSDEENNNENIDDYCKKLRSEQVKMFSNNQELRCSIYKKHKPTPLTNYSIIQVKPNDIKSESSSTISTPSTKKSIISQSILQNQEAMFKSQLLDDQMNNDENQYEFMQSPKINSKLGFDRNNKNKWTSMYGLRDSFRNLTSCVSSKNSRLSKKNKENCLPTKSTHEIYHYSNMNESNLRPTSKSTSTTTTTTTTTTTSYNNENNNIIVYDDNDDNYDSYCLIENNNDTKNKIQKSIKTSFTTPNVSSLLINSQYNQKYNYNDGIRRDIDDNNNNDNSESNMIQENKIKKIKRIYNNEQIQNLIEKYTNSIEKKIESKYSINNINANTNKQQQLNQKQFIYKQKSSTSITNNSNKTNNVDDLCDIIEKVQGTRLDNQRCELSQDLSSATKFLDNIMPFKKQPSGFKSIDSTTDTDQSAATTPKLDSPKSPATQSITRSINYSPERLIKILSMDSGYSKSFDYPMISLPDNNTYWSDGWNTINNSYNNQTYINSNSSSNNNNNYNQKIYNILSRSTNDLRKQKSFDNSDDCNNNLNYDLNIDYNYNNNFIDNNDNDNELSVNTNNQNVLISIENLKNELFSNKNMIMDKDHLDFYGQDIKDFPIILSYKIENTLNSDYIKAILRLKEDNYYVDIPCSNIKDVITPHQICKFIEPNLKIKLLNPILTPNATKLIKNFDEHSYCKNFKFGIIYMKKGQTTEEELFSNQSHSEAFEEFLSFIGKRVKLKDFKGFKGGLDINHGQTGEESVYETFNDKEIMFHVSTLLPFSKSDNQQLERKRHIGNDIVTIIFQDENTPFAPDMIASNFLHAFIVIQKYKISENDATTRYRVAVSARNGVPNFLPEIPKYATFDKSKLFKEWLLLKLMNAEVACYNAEKFKKLKERTRFTLLDELYNDINKQNQKIVQAIYTSNNQNDLNNNNNLINGTDSDSNSNNSPNSLSNNNSYIFNNLNNKSETNVVVNSNTAIVQTTQHTTASFKFNLLHNVRKAFNIKTHKSESKNNNNNKNEDQKQQNKENSSNLTSSNNLLPIFNDATVQNFNNNNNNNNSRGRVRSATIDAPSQIKFSTKSMKDKSEQNKPLVPDYNKIDLKKNLSSQNFQNNILDRNNKTGINEEFNYENTVPSSSSEESSPKSLNSAQNFVINQQYDLKTLPLKKKEFNFPSERGIQSSQDNVLLVEDSDTGLGSLTPNSSGISSSTSFVTDQSLYENTCDTLTTLCENDLKSITSNSTPLNNNSNLQLNNKNKTNKNYFKSPKRRAETLNDQFFKNKGQENTNILAHNEVF